MQEQELFQGYEVKNWNFSPRIYKILAASAIFNILALLTVAQTNLLTKKGCDSPLVGSVCQVLDTLVVGGTILTTESKNLEGDYDKTVLTDADIIWINQTGVEDFKYPEGYFALSNPELMTPQEVPTDGSFPSYIPGIPNPTTGGGTADLMSKQPELPKDNPSAVVGPKIDSPFTVEGNPTVTSPRVKNQRPRTWKNNPTINDKSPDKLPDLTADNKTPNKVEPKTTPTPDGDDVSKEDNFGIYKRKKPLKDFAAKAKTEVKNVKLDAPFTVTMTADLDIGKDGKTVVLKNPKLIKDKNQPVGDEQMAKLAEEAILAIGDSGWLGYLRTIGFKKVVFTLSQDETQMTAKIVGEQKDENSAKTSASGLNGMISVGKAATDGDEKMLLERATTTSEGKMVILNFAIPKEVALEMINRKLKEAEEKPEVKPQSAAQIKETNQNAAK